MNINDIPQLIGCNGYAVDMPWDSLEKWLLNVHPNVVIEPDFQRAHVWDDDTRRAYIEFMLRGGRSARSLYWNCAGWNVGPDDAPLELVDGLQRLTAVRRFMADELRVCGHLRSEFTGHMRMTHHNLRMHINELQTRKEVLTWYLEMNDGGVIHTQDELERVRGLLDAEA